MSRLCSIIGDANVRRNMTQLNMASRETMKTSQLLPCDDMSSLDKALAEVRPESSICIVAAITELLIAADNTGTVSSSIEAVLLAFKTKVVSLCSARPGLHVSVAPPLFRTKPVWYQRSLPQISGIFSSTLSNDVPANLVLLPSFCSQDLCPDGVYLTAVSGLHYVLHLYDQTSVALEVARAPSEAQLYRVNEICRHHDDRIVFLEQRHIGLDDRVSVKTAADAEFHDWVLNRSEEDWLTIIGAKRLPEMPNREWQLAAKRFVNEIIKVILTATNVRLDYSVVYVHNPVRFRKTGQNVLNVHMSSVNASRRIRDLFSGFFSRGAAVRLPASLKGISIRNKVTLETRVRMTIMRQLGLNFQESNGPGSSFKVKGFDSRPLLTTLPPSGVAGARPRTYTFIEAVSLLPGIFSDEGLMQIHQIIGSRHPGQLQSLFVVLRDDDRERIEQLIKDKYRAPSSGVGPASSSGGNFSGLGSGMEVSAALMLPPPPPPALPPPASQPSAASQAPRASTNAVSFAVPKDSGSRSESETEHDRRGKRGRRSPSDDRSESEPRDRRGKKSRRSPSQDRSRKRSRRSKKDRRRRSPSSSSSASSTSTRSSRSEGSGYSYRKSTKHREH